MYALGHTQRRFTFCKGTSQHDQGHLDMHIHVDMHRRHVGMHMHVDMPRGHVGMHKHVDMPGGHLSMHMHVVMPPGILTWICMLSCPLARCREPWRCQEACQHAYACQYTRTREHLNMKKICISGCQGGMSRCTSFHLKMPICMLTCRLAKCKGPTGHIGSWWMWW